MFATASGLYQFIIMPFGLHSPTTTFQQLVESVLGDCTAFSLAYLDNIFIFSPTWAQQLQNLYALFQCLQQPAYTSTLGKAS